MNAKDQFKILCAGFTIIRKDEPNLLIKVKKPGHPEWCTLLKHFDTKAGLERTMKELLQSPEIVED